MLAYDRFDTAIGRIMLVKSAQGICYVGLPGSSISDAEAWAHRHFPGEGLVHDPKRLGPERRELQEYTQGRRHQFSFRTDHRNSPFAREALTAVSRIPFGQTDSYRNIARRISRPNASRAVGRAVATNPLPLVIPCHRVVGSDGSLTGYGGGLPLKQTLLKLEARSV
ncbi:MAG: methylated-DNA--[protein]-cysteine S-methyltransferase [Candidatus Neomarinimicrobiota bacterium]